MHYFVGVDTYSAREALDQLSGSLNSQLRFIDARDLRDVSLSSKLEGSKGLFSNSLFVLREAGTWPVEVPGQIVEAVSSSVSFVVWDTTFPDKRTSYFKAMKKYMKEFSEPSHSALVQWVVAYVGQREARIEPGACDVLISRLSGDKWRIASEIDRLLLTADVLTRDFVMERVVDESQSDDVFALLDALSAQRGGDVVRQFERLLESGESEFRVLSMLAYQFRVLFLLRLGMDSGMSLDAVAKEYKLHPFVVKKNSATARRFSLSQLLDIQTRILATRSSIKQGVVDARTGVSVLLLGQVSRV